MIAFFPSREVLVAVGPVLVHWYGVMYALAFLCGMWMFPRLLRISRIDLTPSDRETFVLWIFLGVLLGGRLGYVLFYGGSYYLENPWKVFAVWEGGMASHGGFLGVLLALFVFCRSRGVDFFRLGDILVIPVALGLAFGRLGNLINGELYGTVTQLPWGMHFPGAEGLRHPTQIYAMLKDLFIMAFCFCHVSRFAEQGIRTGRTGGWFLVLYGVLRFCVEIFREQPLGFTNVLGFQMSRGQLLTVPILIAGVVVLVLRRERS